MGPTPLSLLYYSIELSASVIFVSTFCADVQLAMFPCQSCEDSHTRSWDPAHLKCPWTSNTGDAEVKLLPEV